MKKNRELTKKVLVSLMAGGLIFGGTIGTASAASVGALWIDNADGKFDMYQEKLVAAGDITVKQGGLYVQGDVTASNIYASSTNLVSLSAQGIRIDKDIVVNANKLTTYGTINADNVAVSGSGSL